jgi:hypothetical protein
MEAARKLQTICSEIGYTFLSILVIVNLSEFVSCYEHCISSILFIEYTHVYTLFEIDSI